MLKIATILPYKENYTYSRAAAASLWVSDFFKYSKYKKNNYIFGSTDSCDYLSKNYVNIDLKNNNKLFHLFCAANEAEKRIDVVSNPSFAKRVKIRKTTTDNIYSPNPSAPKYFAISRVRKNPNNWPPIRKKKDTPPFLNSSEKSLSSNAACSLLFIKLIDQKPRVQ